MVSKESVEEMLTQLGVALSEGDSGTVAKHWDVPALVLSDQGSVAVNDRKEVEAFFAKASADYFSRGLVSTRPEIQSFEPMSESMAAVVVRWPAFDSEGMEKSSEKTRYILALGADGKPHIRVAVTEAP